MKNTGLGRGLDALFTDPTFPQQEEDRVYSLPLGEIDINRDQPRKTFAEEALAELAESIKQNGLLQPIVVARKGERYEIVAGERRFRAFRLLGEQKIPALVKNLTEQQAMELSLIENLQREDLNVVESAHAMKLLLERFSLTQQQLAEKLGKSRSAVANTLRILELPEKVLQMLLENKLTEGHARALAGLNDKNKLLWLADQTAQCHFTVRETEAQVRRMNRGPNIINKPQDPHLQECERRVQQYLGTKVRISGSQKRGKMEITYFNRDQLEGLLELLTEKDH